MRVIAFGNQLPEIAPTRLATLPTLPRPLLSLHASDPLARHARVWLNEVEVSPFCSYASERRQYVKIHLLCRPTQHDFAGLRPDKSHKRVRLAGLVRIDTCCTEPSRPEIEEYQKLVDAGLVRWL